MPSRSPEGVKKSRHYVNAGSLYAPRDQPEKRVSESKKRHRVTKLLLARPVTFIFKRDFYTFPTNDVVYVIFWPWRPVNIL